MLTKNCVKKAYKIKNKGNTQGRRAGIPQAAPVRVENPVPEGAGPKTDERIWGS